MANNETMPAERKQVSLVPVLLLAALVPTVQILLLPTVMFTPGAESQLGLLLLLSGSVAVVFGAFAGLLFAIFAGAARAALIVSAVLLLAVAGIYTTSPGPIFLVSVSAASLSSYALTALTLVIIAGAGSWKQLAMGVPLIVLIRLVVLGIAGWLLNWTSLFGGMSPAAELVRFAGFFENQMFPEIAIVTVLASIGTAITAFYIFRQSHGRKPAVIYGRESRTKAFGNVVRFLKQPASYAVVVATALLIVTTTAHVKATLKIYPLRVALQDILDSFGIRVIVESSTIAPLVLGLGGILGVLAIRPWIRGSVLPYAAATALVASVLVYLSDIETSYSMLAANSGRPFSSDEILWPFTLSVLTYVALGTALALSWLASLQIGRNAPIMTLFAVQALGILFAAGVLGMFGGGLWESAGASLGLIIALVYFRVMPEAWEMLTSRKDEPPA